MVLRELLTICNVWVKGVGVIISRQGAKLAKVVRGLGVGMIISRQGAKLAKLCELWAWEKKSLAPLRTLRDPNTPALIPTPLASVTPLRETHARTTHRLAPLRLCVNSHTRTSHSFAPLRALRENIHAHTLSLAIIITLLTNNTQAQVYPVNGSAALIPPYSVYLSDYTSRTTDRLMLNVVLNDINRPELRVRLRLRIESQNIRIETKPEYIGSEIILQGGVPLQLKGIDLTEYFNANNLNFSGITRREFEKTGALPQGFYQFCFEVLEYNRGVKISNTICAPGWLILNDPPLVNLPRMDEKVIPTSPQNVVIQWTPRHTGSPNAAFSTEYEITMVEVWPATRNANDAILTSPPILEATTRSTTFIYGPAETPLELGRRYALRIKAKSIVGAEEYDLFKNNGYSEVVSFVYGDACVAPHNIQVETAATKFKVTWDGQLNHSAYTFRYRPAGSGSWYESNTNINEVNIYSLSPNTTYEYQVSGQCGLFDGQYTPVATIKTNDIGEAAYSCGLPIETFNLDPAELTGSLKAGDVIHAGDFKVKLTKVSGSNGVFSGEGVIEVSFFNKASVKAEFTNISVNKEQRMVSGFMNVTGAGVEVVPSGVMDLMDDLSETLTQFDSVLNDIEANIPQPFDPNSFAADSLVTISGEIHSVYKDTDGTIVIVDSNGTETRLPEGETYAIKDEKGKGYLVDAKGEVHETSATVATNAGNREYNLILKFGPDPLAHFGFDEQEHKSLANYYDHIGEYDVPWKAVASGSTDPVVAHVPDASIDKTKIRFELFSQPAPAPPFSAEHSTSVTVKGKADGDIEDLIALYASGDTTDKEQILGKVKVITYDKIKRHLVIVPVNNNTYTGSASQLTQDLNKIFGQAAVEWSVEIKPKVEVALNTTFDVGSSGLLSNYTTDMKTVINAYEDDMDDDSYYLFLVSKPSDAKLLGYMPRSKQAGFIFVDTNGNVARMTQTIAHELGHGAFNLEHTFSQFTALTKGSTNNLMDYAEGTMLHKYQWDNIHHPAIVIGLFESDTTGQSVLASLKQISSINKENNYFGFLTPSGERIILSNDIYPIFFHGIENDQYNDVVPGVLIAFRDKPLPGNPISSGKLHTAQFTGTTFTGYSDFEYKKPTLSNDDRSLILGLPCIKDESNFAIYKFKPKTVREYAGQSAPILSILSDELLSLGFFTDEVKPFDVDYRNSGSLLGEGQIQISDFELKIIKGKYVDIERLLKMQTLFAGVTQISHIEAPEIFQIIKIAEYHNRYPIIFESFSSWFDTWNALGLVKEATALSPTALDNIFTMYHDKGVWDGKFVSLETISNENSEFNIWKKNLAFHNLKAYNIYRSFLYELRSHTTTIATKNRACLASLQSEGNRENVYECISMASEDDLKMLSFSDRMFAIKELLKQFWVDGESEKLIVKLIMHTPTGFSADDFIKELETDCEVTVRAYARSTQKLVYEKTVCFWEILFSAVNDSQILFSGDNRKELIKNLINHYYQSTKFKQQMSDYVQNMNVLNIEEVEKRRFEYDYQGIFRRLWTDVKGYGLYYPLPASATDHYVSLDTKVININTQGLPTTIEVAQKIKGGFFYEVFLSESIFSPFDLAIFTNRSNQDLLSDYAGKSSDGKPLAIPVPVLVLHYASVVGNNETSGQLVQTAIDAATLVIPGAQLAHLSKLGKVIYYADKISSVASMGATAFESSDPEIANLFNALSLVTGVADVASITHASKLNAIEKSSGLIDRDLATIVKNTTDLADEIIELSGTEKGIEKLNKLTSKQAETFIEVIKKDKEFLSELGHLTSTQEVKLIEALKHLDEVATKSFKSVDDLIAMAAKFEPASTYDVILKADFSASPKLAEVLGKQPELLAVWKMAKDADIDEILRRNPKVLENMFSLPCK